MTSEHVAASGFLRVLLLLSAAALASAGCSSQPNPGPDEPVRAIELREVGELLAQLTTETSKGYSNVGQLAKYEQGFPLGVRALKAGEIVVVPGATMLGESAKGSTEAVVAYDRDVPTKGGLVLLHNRTVKQMSADEFRTAPKAGK